MLSGWRSPFGVGAAAVAFVGLAAGVYAYDSSRDDLIAHGVRVAGVDVGGLRAHAARERLEAELSQKLRRPVRVRVAGRGFKLTAERARLVADFGGMARAAVEKSRSGGLPGRLWRVLTGARVEADLPAQVNHSSAAIGRFVKQVERTVNRPPRDAELELSTASLPAIPSQTGLKVDGERLRRSVEEAIELPGAGRKVRAKVEVVQPKVTTDELAQKYPYFITIDRGAKALRFFKRLSLAKAYPIAVGQIGFETPAGLYHVENKAINPAWTPPAWAGPELAGKTIPGGAPDNPLKARWLGFFDGAGIHGTDAIGSLGTAASHGCIRMSVPDVLELYDQVPLRTPVYVQ